MDTLYTWQLKSEQGFQESVQKIVKFGFASLDLEDYSVKNIHVFLPGNS